MVDAGVVSIKVSLDVLPKPVADFVDAPQRLILIVHRFKNRSLQVRDTID